jgi:prolyl-tRNA synthetase
MKLSNYFLPTVKENPADATVISHQLMIRAGMIRQTASGIYSWLPLGLKVLRKIENIIKSEMNKIGALEILMPTIQPKELWVESGRYDDYGKEMLRIKDRHERDILYGPTHEEVVTDIFRKNINSYKDLPKNLYQIHWKFRDEIRPRFGVMRGREFLMKDGYSFDLDAVSARRTYDSIYETYFKIFKRMGLKPIALRANTGAVGGDLSHEFHILANTGESEIFYDKKFDELSSSSDFSASEMQKIYAMADEMYDKEKCPIRADQLVSKRGIEVGHIFNFGTKYSKAMQASVLGASGEKIYPDMGSYGIGVSRLVAAIIESSHDQKGIIWHKNISPFQVILINLKPGEPACDRLCEHIYERLLYKNVDILYDDTKNTAGQKFATADLIGISTQLVVGPNGAKNEKIEVRSRKNPEEKSEVEISWILSDFLATLLK